MDISERVIKLINQTNQNVFLTGKAGTGKTTLLKKIVQTTHKNYVIVAPTGVAAMNAGGVTIHSMFQLPFSSYLPVDYYDNYNDSVHFETNQTILRHFKVRADKRAVLNSMELLIIDEVSMLRPDVLDAMNLMLQFVRHNKKLFGGVQVLFIGDLMQLPPIIKNNEWDVLRQFYNGKFFFHAHSLQIEQPIYVELTKIWRQTDEEFIAVLEKMRLNDFDDELKETLNIYVDKDFSVERNPGYIALSTHNQFVNDMNYDAMSRLNERSYNFKADVIDEFPEYLYPIEYSLRLKKGAQVMFVKNDLSFEKRYFNGKIGVVKSLSDDEIIVRFEKENKEIEVEKFVWENKKFNLNPQTQEIEEEILGTFTQYPLRLAWAITIHKSQGLTFEKAAIDMSRVFAPGQAYVALSRLTSLSGLKLIQPIGNKKLGVERDILDYEKNKTDTTILEKNMEDYSKDFLFETVLNCFQYYGLKRWVSKMEKDLVEAKESNIVFREKAWIQTISKTILKLSEVAEKFQLSLKNKLNVKEINIDYLSNRVDKAHEFFHEKWTEVEKSILRKLVELSYVTRVKQFENDVYELESLVLGFIRNLIKTKKIVHAVLKSLDLNKETLSTKEVETWKQGVLSELKKTEKFDLKSLAGPFEEKKKGEKAPKKSTYELSFELWEQYEDIEKIAAIRKLTSQTVFGHLVKYVEKGELEIVDLIDMDKLKEIKKQLDGRKDFESLTEMKNFLNNRFEYNELKLYKVWSYGASD